MDRISLDPAQNKWFGVRLVFRLLEDGRPTTTYEERITLWRAESAEEAIELAENEADDYTSTVDEPPYLEYLGTAQVFRTFIPDRPIESGDEVFSLMRDSKFGSDKYIRKFFSTGGEHQEKILGDEDGVRSASA